MTVSRVVIVTGATGAIGSYVARAFAKDGWVVILGYHTNELRARELASECAQYPLSETLPWQMDLADQESLKRLVDGVSDRYARIDALINCAGVAADSLLLSMPQDSWDTVVRVNLTGTFTLVRLVARVMIKRRDGHIITLGSWLGLRGQKGASNYAATKAALIGLVTSAAQELGRFSVRINVVTPGFHESQIQHTAASGALARARAESALGITTDPEELASFIVFLAKTQSITGQVFNCDSRIP